MPNVARIKTRPGTRPSLLILDTGAALGLSLARVVRRYGCDAVISTSVAHAAATLLQTSVQLLIVHDSARISPSQVAMLRARAEGGALPCVVLGSTSSRLVDADTRVLQTPVETDSVMQAIKAALGLSRGPRRTPTHSRTRRVSSFSIPKARGEFSMPSEPARPQRRSDAPGPDARHGYSVQSRARKTLRLMPAVSNSMNRL